MSITAASQPDQMLNAAITAIRAGETERGRALLAQVLRANPSCEIAWLWMATVVETPQQKRECLERALAINPQNSIARRELESLSVTAPGALVQTQRAVDPAVDAPSAPVDVARCPNCGAAIDTTDRRCGFCGSLLHAPLHVLDSRAPSNKAQKREPLSENERSELLGFDPIFPIISMMFIFLGIPVLAVMVTLFLLRSVQPVFMIVFMLLFYVIYGIIHYFVVHTKEAQLKNGSKDEAQIIDMWTAEVADDVLYFVAWELIIPDQKGDAVRFRKAQRVNRETYSLLEARDTVLVRYIPHKPQCSELDEQWLSELEKR
ncbi:MAG: hypothetical protein NZM94_08150 [Roseiflexus sp.]|nr:hypothetical protein [Roseiflexus sp.]